MKKALIRILFLAIGLSALGIMVYKIGIHEIYDGIVKTGWWFAAIIVLWAVIYFFNALSWNIIIKDGEKNSHKISFANVYRITISGFAINYITPFVALGGEPYRIWELKNYVGTNKATSSVILFSMMHIFTHFIFWFFAIILTFIYLKPALFPSLLLIVLAGIMGFICLYFLKGYKYGLLVKTFRILCKIPFVNKPIRRFYDKKQASLKEIDSHISHLHGKRRSSFYWSVITEFMSRLLACVEIYFIALGVAQLYPDMNMNMWDAIIIYAGYSLFANLVFFTPMQLGSREGGFLLAFESVGLPSAPAMIVSLITRIRELFWILVGFLLMKVSSAKHPLKEEDGIEDLIEVDNNSN